MVEKESEKFEDGDGIHMRFCHVNHEEPGYA